MKDIAPLSLIDRLESQAKPYVSQLLWMSGRLKSANLNPDGIVMVLPRSWFRKAERKENRSGAMFFGHQVVLADIDTPIIGVRI